MKRLFVRNIHSSNVHNIARLISLAKDESRRLVKSERVVPSEACVKKGTIHLTVRARVVSVIKLIRDTMRYDAIRRDTNDTHATRARFSKPALLYA